jgi:hypothetical protein
LQNDSDDDLLKASSASAFFKYVAALAEKRPRSISPVCDVVLEVLFYIAKNQNRYGADERVYGSFLDSYENIRPRLQ